MITMWHRWCSSNDINMHFIYCFDYIYCKCTNCECVESWVGNLCVHTGPKSTPIKSEPKREREQMREKSTGIICESYPKAMLKPHPQSTIWIEQRQVTAHIYTRTQTVIVCQICTSISFSPRCCCCCSCVRACVRVCGDSISHLIISFSGVEFGRESLFRTTELSFSCKYLFQDV